MPRYAHPAALLLLMLAGCGGTAPLAGRSSFASFHSAYESASTDAGRDSLLDAFWSAARDSGCPLVQENGTEVVFVFRGNADSVKVTGDFNRWTNPLPLHRLGRSDFFHRTVTLPRDARLDYVLVLDTGKTIVDPGCPITVPGGYGTRSEVAMPDFRRSTEWLHRPDVPMGSLSTILHRSLILGYEHTVHIYTPPGYDSTAERYPTVYFQDGNDYVFFGGARATLDNLIAAGDIPPVLGVFVAPPLQPERDRRVEYSLNEQYMQFFVRELIPFVDAQYRTLAHRNHRLLVGSSRGGLISLGIGLLHSDAAAGVASQSGYVSWSGDSLLTLFRSHPPRDLRIYADVGTYETALAGHPEGDRDFLAGNRRFRDLLRAQGYDLEYREFTDSHSWGRWRNELPAILRLYFGRTR